MVRRGECERNVKLGTGGIREIEFIVQSLQLRHAHGHKRIMERNTLLALRQLVNSGLVPQSTAVQLAQAYEFLRNIEHKLQMVDDLQTHVIPSEPIEIAKCAIRLGYQKKCSTPHFAATSLLNDYRQTTSYVHQVFTQVIG
jgi:glutamate-ammonia-ligase adenylyltransferase